MGGLSILEDKIVLKLTSEAFKSSSNHQPTAGSTGTIYQNIIESSSRELLLKINELILLVNSVKKANGELKLMVASL